VVVSSASDVAMRRGFMGGICSVRFVIKAYRNKTLFPVGK
jgi:hypothetical protein